MILKKSLILSAVVACLGFSIAAQAEEELVTVNNSAQPSTVMVNGMCVGKLPPPLGVITPANGGVSRVLQSNVVKICGGPRVHLCVANIHMTANCSDRVVAVAKLNMDNFTLEDPAMTPGVPYRISKSGKSSVVINPA